VAILYVRQFLHVIGEERGVFRTDKYLIL